MEGETTKGPYWLAPEVERYVHQMVEESALFPHLQGIPIMCLFTDKDMKIKGRLALAKIKKASEIEIAMVEAMRETTLTSFPSGSVHQNHPAPTYLIIVNYDCWLDLEESYREPMQGKTVNQKEALVFHELSHVKTREDEKTGEIKFSSKDHDFQGFYAEVYKYGAWLPMYEDIVLSVKGEKLAGEEEPSATPITTDKPAN